MKSDNLKKWAPFSALTEQSEILKKILSHKNIEQEMQLSEDQEEEINYILTNFLDRKLKISYFDEYIKVIEGKIDKIDYINRQLKCANTLISIDSIKNIQVK